MVDEGGVVVENEGGFRCKSNSCPFDFEEQLTLIRGVSWQSECRQKN